MNVYKDGLRLYGPDRLLTSYNGGKDAVVVMQVSCRNHNVQYFVYKWLLLIAAQLAYVLCCNF
eukprot:19016-Heterococcus_DN1.PRE.2